MIGATRCVLVGQIAIPGILRSNGVLVTDLFSEAGDCVKDDVEEYKVDGTWSFDNGALKCDNNHA